jgi:hypothetical protein
VRFGFLSLPQDPYMEEASEKQWSHKQEDRAQDYKALEYSYWLIDLICCLFLLFPSGGGRRNSCCCWFTHRPIIWWLGSICRESTTSSSFIIC